MLKHDCSQQLCTNCETATAATKNYDSITMSTVSSSVSTDGSTTSCSSSSYEADAANGAADGDRAKALLTTAQVDRLQRVLAGPIEVHGLANFPHLSIQLRQLILAVQAQLLVNSIQLTSTKLNGGGASHIMVCRLTAGVITPIIAGGHEALPLLGHRSHLQRQSNHDRPVAVGAGARVRAHSRLGAGRAALAAAGVDAAREDRPHDRQGRVHTQDGQGDRRHGRPLVPFHTQQHERTLR